MHQPLSALYAAPPYQTRNECGLLGVAKITPTFGWQVVGLLGPDGLYYD
jgi:hypothetical protein